MPTRSIAKPKPIKESPINTGNKFKPNTRPETIRRVTEAAKMISEGKSQMTVVSHFMDTYGLEVDQAKNYWQAGARFLCPEDPDEYKKSLIETNIRRLEKIVEEGMKDNSNLKVAREAIAELNKMLGITTTGVQVGVRTDKNNDTTEVVVNFGE